MEHYKVIKTILKGYSIDNPRRYSHKVIAKVGTILIAEQDDNRLGGVEVLKTKGGRYICDVGSFTANEHCVKI